jgi:hypothetical protein
MPKKKSEPRERMSSSGALSPSAEKNSWVVAGRDAAEPPAAVEINIVGDTGHIQQVKQLAERLLIPAAAKGFPQVIMRIDDGKFRFVYQRGFGY